MLKVHASIRARLATIGASTLLVGGLFAQAAPAFAGSSSNAPAVQQAAPDSNVRLGRSGTANIKQLALEPHKKLPFNPAVVSSTLARLGAKTGASSVHPEVVGPPNPDPETSSGAAAASTPVAATGHSGTVTPDPSIAVGPDEVLQADITGLEVRDRAGTSLAPEVSLPTLFALPESSGYTTFFSDPRVIFDALHQRWIVSELSWDCATYSGATFGHGFIDYGISDTADPLGTWTTAGFEWLDFVPTRPAAATSTDKLALTTSLFAMGAGGSTTTPGCASGGLSGAEFVVVDWTDLGSAFNSANVHYSVGGYANLDAIRVAVQEPVVDSDLRMIGIGNGASAGDIWYTDVTGSAVHHTVGEAVHKDLTADAIVPGFGSPTPPTQSGGGGILTSTIDGQPDSLVSSSGKLAFTSTTPCTPNGDSSLRDCIRVTTLGSVNPAAEPSRIADVLLGTNGLDSSFGGIAWSGNGVLTAVYTSSSGGVFAATVAQYHRPSDGPDAWSDPQTLTAGAATYTGTGWGPYLTVAADPQVPSAAWVGDPAANGSGGWTTTVHELSVGDVGAGYTPVTPTRFLDTRSGNGLSGNFVAGVPRTFTIGGASRTPAGGPTVTIPANAVAITGNLTVTGQTAAGYVSLTPTPTANPSSSTINFPVGDNRANNVTVALGPNGNLSAVYVASSGKHTALLLDVTGYFVAGSGQTYTPLSPTRFLDSRPGPGNLGQTTFHANVSKSVPIAGATCGGCAVPSNATAITANLTVVGQTTAGYVSLTPTIDNAPKTSTINFPVGDIRANGVTIQLDPITGDLSAVYVAVSGTADLILDVTGYYSSSGGAGLFFHPLNPGRRIDTRQPLGQSGFGNGLSGPQGTTPRSATVAGHFGVPSGAAAITGNLTVTAQTGAGYVSVTAASIAHPLTSTINFPLGDNRANGITVPLGSGSLWFDYQSLATKNVQLILDITGYFE